MIVIISLRTDPPYPQVMYKTIMVPLDGSALAERALAHAVEMARCGQGRILLLRVIAPGDRTLAWADLDYDQTVAEDEMVRRGHAESYLEEMRERPELKDLVYLTRVPCGNPAEEILDYALTEKVDLVVMSSHGRTGLGRFFMGSVAERVVRHASCPVLVVAAEHSPPADEAAKKT